MAASRPVLGARDALVPCVHSGSPVGRPRHHGSRFANGRQTPTTESRLAKKGFDDFAAPRVLVDRRVDRAHGRNEFVHDGEDLLPGERDIARPGLVTILRVPVALLVCPKLAAARGHEGRRSQTASVTSRRSLVAELRHYTLS
jgi:hypothetical protein